MESHTPKIEIEEKIKADEPFEVKISVGPHPNTIQHSTRKIDVYFYEDGKAFNPIYLASIILTPVYTEPEISLKLKVSKSGTLYVLEYWNLHGIWEGRKEIRVK